MRPHQMSLEDCLTHLLTLANGRRSKWNAWGWTKWPLPWTIQAVFKEGFSSQQCAPFKIHAREEMGQGSFLTGRGWVLHPLPSFCSYSVTSEIHIHLQALRVPIATVSTTHSPPELVVLDPLPLSGIMLHTAFNPFTPALSPLETHTSPCLHEFQSLLNCNSFTFQSFWVNLWSQTQIGFSQQ